MNANPLIEFTLLAFGSLFVIVDPFAGGDFFKNGPEFRRDELGCDGHFALRKSFHINKNAPWLLQDAFAVRAAR